MRVRAPFVEHDGVRRLVDVELSPSGKFPRRVTLTELDPDSADSRPVTYRLEERWADGPVPGAKPTLLDRRYVRVDPKPPRDRDNARGQHA